MLSTKHFRKSLLRGPEYRKANNLKCLNGWGSSENHLETLYWMKSRKWQTQKILQKWDTFTGSSSFYLILLSHSFSLPWLAFFFPVHTQTHIHTHTHTGRHPLILRTVFCNVFQNFSGAYKNVNPHSEILTELIWMGTRHPDDCNVWTEGPLDCEPSYVITDISALRTRSFIFWLLMLYLKDKLMCLSIYVFLYLAFSHWL